MVSTELLRRYAFFAGLSHEEIHTLASVSSEQKVDAGHIFVREGDDVPCLYLVVSGKVSSYIALPAPYGELVVGTVGEGDVFVWSALIPPHTAIASVRSTTPCHVVAIDCRKLLAGFEKDPAFGYRMMTKAAQITRDRIATMNMETLAYLVEAKKGK